MHYDKFKLCHFFKSRVLLRLRFIKVLALLFSAVCFSHNSSIASVICEDLAANNLTEPGASFKLLTSLKPASLQKVYPGEERFYFTATEMENYTLLVVKGRFVSKSDSTPFTTFHSSETLPVRPDEKYKASIDVSAQGNLLGMKERIEGKFHHSTMVAGQDLSFAGEVTTDNTGKLLWASYRSGHYPHGPYRMKLFLDELAQNKVDLNEVRISLSDRADIRVGRTTIPAEFFRGHVQENWNGDDVALAYLLSEKPSEFLALNPERKWEIEEPIIDIRYFCQEPAAVDRLLKSSFEAQKLVSRLADWMDHYIAINEFGMPRVKANIIRDLNEIPLFKRLGWRQDLMDELKQRHPDLF